VKKKTFSGLLKKISTISYTWLSLQEIFTFIINYGLVLFMARILKPESFGTVALLNLYSGLFSIISSLGIGKLIVRDQIKNRIKLNILFTGNLMVSSVLFIIALLFLPLYLQVYFTLNYYYFFLGLISLLTIFTSSFYTYIVSIYIRDKNFIKMAKLVIIAYSISAILVVVLTLLLRTTTALLLKQLLVSVTISIILLVNSNLKLRIYFSKIVLNYLFSFSKFITVNNIFNYFVRNVDYMILGYFFNKNIIGQYNIAYKILLTPVKMIVKQIDSITFPSLSKLRFNKKEFKLYYLSSISLLTQTLYPFIIAIILFSNLIVELFFDDKYDKLPMIISLLSISALFQSVSSLSGNLYIISDNTKKMFYLSVIKFVFLVVALYFSARTKDIYIFSATYTFTYILTNFTLSNYYAIKPFEIPFLIILKKMLYSTVISSLFLGVLYYLFYIYKLDLYIKVVLIVLFLGAVYLIINERLKKLLKHYI
jgi:PST family polysaccharide transporter